MRKTTKIQHCRNRSNEKNNKNTTMSEQIQWEKQQKYNTVGTGPTRNKKYLTVSTVPKFNGNFVERGKIVTPSTQIHERSHFPGLAQAFQ
jgi:hypothetical protein